jgi:hypothetical protein
VAHTCNPSYSGGSSQEDHCWKPDQAKVVLETLSQKNKTKQKNRSRKRTGGMAQGVSPEFKSQYHIHKNTFKDIRTNVVFYLPVLGNH